MPNSVNVGGLSPVVVGSSTMGGISGLLLKPNTGQLTQSLGLKFTEPMRLQQVTTAESNRLFFVRPSTEVSATSIRIRNRLAQARVASVYPINTDNGDYFYTAFLVSLLLNISRGKVPITQLWIESTLPPGGGNSRQTFINLLCDVASHPNELENVIHNFDQMYNAIRYLHMFLENLLTKAWNNGSLNERAFKNMLAENQPEGTMSIQRADVLSLIREYVGFMGQNIGEQSILMLSNAFRLPMIITVGDNEYPSVPDMSPLTCVIKDGSGLFVGCIPDVPQKKSGENCQIF